MDFIRKKFLDQNEQKGKPGGRQIYVHVTCATDRENVERVTSITSNHFYFSFCLSMRLTVIGVQVFNDVQHIVVNNSLVKGGLL